MLRPVVALYQFMRCKIEFTVNFIHSFPVAVPAWPTRKAMQQRIKVWYKQVGVQRVVKEALRPSWCVTLDGRPILTPAKVQLELPTEPMAWAVAMEWKGQGKMLQAYTMPLTKLATTSIDQIPSIRPTMQSSMLRTMETDVACIRADPEHEPVMTLRM